MKGLQICMEIMVLFYYCPREKKKKNYSFEIQSHVTGQPKTQSRLKKTGKKNLI
jgi:hypothetical protein